MLGDGEPDGAQSMLTLTLASALALGAPAPKDGRKPVDPPDGEWTVERFEGEGASWDPTPGRMSKLQARFTPTKFEIRSASGGSVIHSQRAAWFEAGKTLQAEFDPGDPKKEAKAIWKFEGDTLTICRGNPGQPRPTEFDAPPGSGRVLMVFKRKPK